MIDMEMGAEHRVDRLAGIAGSGETSRKAVRRPFQAGMARCCLSLPIQVSTMTRRLGVSTTRACTLILSRPSASAKCGLSHAIGSTASRVACGRMKRLPPTASSSTILVTVTSPIRHRIMGRLPQRA
jgi:hypothetical protein